MIITRTERYTDWVYQGAHANEKAATVGVGLLDGFIYYRYSHDNLKEGDTLLREKSFVVLSDGTEYELGTGMSSDKITITYNGQTSDGSVSITVKGYDEVGVGVQSIQRTMTISYDDGRTPVLDTDQLNGILDELSQSLTQSMQDTAEEVKRELKEQIDTAAIDLEHKCNTAVSGVETSLRGEITQVQESNTQLNDKVSQMKGEVDTVSNTLTTFKQSTELELERLTEAHNTVVQSVSDRIRVAQWSVGTFTMTTDDYYLNLFYATPARPKGDTAVFQYNPTHKSMNMVTSMFPKGRILRFSGRLSLEFQGNFEGTLSFMMTNAAGNVIARQPIRIKSQDIVNGANKSHYTYFEVETYADTNHPVCTTGVRAVLHKVGAGRVVVMDDSHITLSLI